MLSSKTYSITARHISQQAYTKASNTGVSDELGHSVALDGDTLVVGAPFEASNGIGVNPSTQNDNNAVESGAVYVFTRSSGVWTQQAYIKASNAEAGDQFGWSVADPAIPGLSRPISKRRTPAAAISLGGVWRSPATRWR
ncbi:MAG: hypothetical protein E8D47_04640 [Nitrospira sp.]|nr:MAG: hypothetical protein E8D47_04640 [Nitrospira sp.]